MANEKTTSVTVGDDYERGMTAEGWNPKPGDSVGGTIVGIYKGGSDAKGDFGFYPILGIKQDNGIFVAVHAFHTLLKEALKEAKAAKGAKVSITYDGTRESKNLDPKGEKQTYHTYTVFVNGKLAGAREAWSWDD